MAWFKALRARLMGLMISTEPTITSVCRIAARLPALRRRLPQASGSKWTASPEGERFLTSGTMGAAREHGMLTMILLAELMRLACLFLQTGLPCSIGILLSG